MAVYKEGFDAIRNYNSAKQQIWNDACDEGVLVHTGNLFFKYMKTIVEMYGDESTRIATKNNVQVDITLIDEWAVSDERKSLKDATEKYTIHYHKFSDKEKNSPSMIRKSYDGFFNIEKK